MGFLSVGNLPYVMDSVGKHAVQAEEVGPFYRPRNFIVCKSRSARGYDTIIYFLFYFFFTVFASPWDSTSTNVVTAHGNWRKLSVKQKVRAIGDQIFVEKDRLLDSALTCTGPTRSTMEKRWQGTTRRDAPARRRSISLPRRNWRYPKVLLRMSVIDREMDRRGCYWNISIKV